MRTVTMRSPGGSALHARLAEARHAHLLPVANARGNLDRDPLTIGNAP